MAYYTINPLTGKRVKMPSKEWFDEYKGLLYPGHSSYTGKKTSELKAPTVTLPKVEEPKVPPVITIPKVEKPKLVLPKIERPKIKPIVSDGKGQYIIKAGDNLGSIAKKFNITLEDILDLNRDKISDPDVIRQGDVIRIPEIKTEAEPKVPSVSDLFRIGTKEKIEFKAPTKKEIAEISVGAPPIVGTTPDIGVDPLSPIITKVKDWVNANVPIHDQKEADEYFKEFSPTVQKSWTSEDIQRENERYFKRFYPVTIQTVKDVLSNIHPSASLLMDKDQYKSYLEIKAAPAYGGLLKDYIGKSSIGIKDLQNMQAQFNVRRPILPALEIRQSDTKNLAFGLDLVPVHYNTTPMFSAELMEGSKGPSGESIEALKKSKHPPIDSTTALYLFFSWGRDATSFIDEHSQYMVNLIKDPETGFLLDIDQDALNGSIDQLVLDEIAKVDVTLPSILQESNKRVAGFEEKLNQTADLFAEIVNQFSLFIIDPTNFTTTIQLDAAQKTAEMLASEEDMQELDPTFANLTSVYNKYKSTFQRAQDYLPQISILNREIEDLLTPDIESYFESNYNYSTLNDAQKITLEEFYNAHKKVIDALRNKASQQLEIQDFVTAHEAELAEFGDAQARAQAALGASINVPFGRLIRSKEFIQTLTAYSRSSATPNTKLLQYFQELFAVAAWFDEHDAEIKAATLTLDKKKQDFELTVIAFEEKIQEDMNSLFDILRQQSKAQIDYQKLRTTEEIARGEESSRVLSLINAPYVYKTAPDKFYNMWKNRKDIWKNKAPLVAHLLPSIMQNIGADPFVEYGDKWKHSATIPSLFGKDFIKEWKSLAETPSLVIATLIKEAWRGLSWMQINFVEPITKKIVIPAIQATGAEVAKKVAFWTYEGVAKYAEIIGDAKFRENMSYAESLATLQAKINLPILAADIAYAKPFGTEEEMADLLMMIDNPKIMEQERKEALLNQIFTKKALGAAARWQESFEYYSGFENKGALSAAKVSDFLDVSADVGHLETFKVSKDTRIEELFGKQWQDRVMDFLQLNPHIEDPFNILKGTELTIPNMETPNAMRILAPEIRMKFAVAHPAYYFMANMIPEFAFDPLNILWFKYADIFPKVSGFLGMKSYKKISTLAESYAWARTAKEAWWFSDAFGRLLTNKPLAEKFVRESAEHGLKKFLFSSIKNLDNLRQGLQGISLAKSFPYKIRKPIAELSDKMRMTMDFGTENFNIGLVMDTAKKDPVIFKKLQNDIRRSLMHPDLPPSEILSRIMKKNGVNTYEIRDALKRYVGSEKWGQTYISAVYKAKHRERFLAQNFIDDMHAQSPHVQDMFSSLVGASKKELPKVRDHFKSYYKYYPEEIKTAEKYYVSYIKKTEAARLAYNSSKELVKVGDHTNWRWYKDTTRVKARKYFEGKKFIEHNNKGERTIIFDRFAYHDLPDMAADGILEATKKFLKSVDDQFVYTLEYSLPYTRAEIITIVQSVMDDTLKPSALKKLLIDLKGKGFVSKLTPAQIKEQARKLVTTNVDSYIAGGVPRSLMTSRKSVAKSMFLKDVRINDFYTNQLPRFLPEERKRLLRLLDAIVPADVIKKEWKKTWRREASDRAFEAYTSGMFDYEGVKLFGAVKDSFTYYSNTRKIGEFLNHYASFRKFEVSNPNLFKEYINYLKTVPKGKQIVTEVASSTWRMADNFGMNIEDFIRFNPALRDTKIIKKGTKLMVREWSIAQELDDFIYKLSDRSSTPLQRLIFADKQLTNHELAEVKTIINDLANKHLERAKPLQLNRARKNLLKRGIPEAEIKTYLSYIEHGMKIDFPITVWDSFGFNKMKGLYGIETKKVLIGRAIKKKLPALVGKKEEITAIKESMIALEMQKKWEGSLKLLSTKKKKNIIKFTMENNLDLKKAMDAKTFLPTEGFPAKYILTKQDLSLIQSTIIDGKTLVFTNTTNKGKAIETWLRLNPRFKNGLHYEINGPGIKKMLIPENLIHEFKKSNIKNAVAPDDFIDKLKELGVYNHLRMNGANSPDDIIKMLAVSKDITNNGKKIISLIDEFKTSEAFRQLKTVYHTSLKKNDEGLQILKELNKGSMGQVTSVPGAYFWDDVSTKALKENINKYIKYKQAPTDTTVAKLFGNDAATFWLFEQNTFGQYVKRLLGAEDLELILSKSGNVKAIIFKKARSPISPMDYEKICLQQTGGKFLIKPKNKKLLEAFAKEEAGEVFNQFSTNTQDLVKLFGTMSDWSDLTKISKARNELDDIAKKIIELTKEKQLIDEKLILFKKKGIADIEGSLSKYLKVASDLKLISPIDIKKDIFSQQLRALTELQRKKLLNVKLLTTGNVRKIKQDLKKGLQELQNLQLSEGGKTLKFLKDDLLRREKAVRVSIDTVWKKQLKFKNLIAKRPVDVKNLKVLHGRYARNIKVEKTLKEELQYILQKKQNVVADYKQSHRYYPDYIKKVTKENARLTDLLTHPPISDWEYVLSIMKGGSKDDLIKISKNVNHRFTVLEGRQNSLQDLIIRQGDSLNGLITQAPLDIPRAQRVATAAFQQKHGLGKDYLKLLYQRRTELQEFLSKESIARLKKTMNKMSIEEYSSFIGKTVTAKEYATYLSRVMTLDQFAIHIGNLRSELKHLNLYEPFAVPYQIAAINSLLPDIGDAKLLASGIIPDSYLPKLKKLNKLIREGREITKGQFSLELAAPSVKLPFTTEKMVGYSWSEMQKLFPSYKTNLLKIEKYSFAKVGEKGAGMTIESIDKLLKRFKKNGVKTIIDDTGRITDLVGDSIYGIKVIHIPELAQENLSYIAKASSPMLKNQQLAMVKIRDILFRDRHVAIVGFGSQRISKIKDLAYRTLSPFEKKYINVLWKDRLEMNLIQRGATVKGTKFVLPRGKGEAFESWQTSIYQIPSETGVEIAVREAKLAIGKEPVWMRKIIKTKDVYQNGKVLLIGGQSPILPLSVKESLEDAVKKGCDFYVPLQMPSSYPLKLVPSEASMLEYIHIINPKANVNFLKLDKSLIQEIAANTNSKLPEFIISSTKNSKYLDSIRKQAFDALLGRGRIFQSSQQLQTILTKELSSTLQRFKANPHKFFPVSFQAGLIQDPNAIKWVSKWITMIKREKIQSMWKKQKVSLLTEFQDDFTDEVLNDLHITKVTPHAQDIINHEVSAIKHGLDQFDKTFGFIDHRPGWFMRWRETIANKLFLNKKLADMGVYGIDGKPVKPDQWDIIKDTYYHVMNQPLEKVIVPIRTALGTIRSGWIRGVLYYRYAWHIRNAIDDAFRQAMAAHDAKLFFQIVGAYGDVTLEFANQVSENFARLISDATGFYSWGPGLKKFVAKHIGKPTAKTFFGGMDTKFKYSSFDIVKALREKSPKFWGTRYGTAANWMLPETKSVMNPMTGKLIDVSDAKYASSAGFYSMFEDPVMTKVWLSRLSDAGYFKRLGKRFAILDADIQIYAGVSEELRRLMTYNALVFDKGIEMAKAEALVKKWSFDYSDVDFAGRQARKLFPFFTFNRKSVSLWLTECLKYSYPAYHAGKALLKAWSLLTLDLPDYYQDRFPLGGDIWVKLPFSWVDILSLFKDPTRTLQELLDNPARLPLGLSWHPGVSAMIENATKKSYFTLSWELKNKQGWSDWEIQHYLKEQDIKDRDLSTGTEGWMTMALSFIPGIQLMQTLTQIDVSNMMSEHSILESRATRELFKLFGLNIRKLTDLEKARWAYFNLPPSLRAMWLKKLEDEQPGAYVNLMDYFSKAQIVKVFNAKPKDKEDAMKKLIESTTINTFYSLEDFNPGEGYAWLKRRPKSQEIMTKHWDGLTMTPWRLVSRAKHEENVLKGIYKTYLKPIPSGMTEEKRKKYQILGLPDPSKEAYDKDELYNSLIDEYGHVIPRTVEEANVILGRDWVSKGLALITSDVIADAATQEETWRMSASEETNKEEKEYQYNLSKVFAIIPDDINDLEEEEQTKYWDIWRENMKRYLTEEQQEKYTSNIPAVQKQYKDAMEDYIERWKPIIAHFGEEDFEYFTEFYNQPKTFQQIYFVSHPDKAIWYPTAGEWLSGLSKIEKIEKETFVYQKKAREDLMTWLWGREDILKAWDKSNPGFYYKMKGWKDLFAITEDHPELYYPEFYSKPKDWIDMVFEDDPDKALTYPFMYKFTQLMQLDKKNWEEKGKRTHLASDWFWSSRNKEARDIYNKNHLPVAKGHDILEYYTVWKNIMNLTEENPKEYFETFNVQPQWFKDYYLSLPKNADKAIYYPLAMLLSNIKPEQFSIEFWKDKWKAAREAWDRDKPGFLEYMKFWRKLSVFADTKRWKEYYTYYFSDSSTKFRERYAKNNPEGAARMIIMKDYVNMSTTTWEDRRAKREFLKKHPELVKHWQENISEEEAMLREKSEKYYTYLDNIRPDGSGKSYFLEYRKWKMFAKDYLKKNPDLALYFQKNSEEYTGEKLELSNELQEYESLTFPEERTKFLDSHEALNKYFYYSNPPGIRKIIDIQNTYFDLPDNKRQAYLDKHPELLDWWDITKLPNSYFTNPKHFKKFQVDFNKVLEYFTAYSKGEYSKAEMLFKHLPNIYKYPGSSEEDDWFTIAAYREAMKAWSSIKGWAYSIYFFRQLPRWMRDQYFKKHPNSKLLSYLQLHRLLEEPLREAYLTQPGYAWVTKQFYRYDKNIPYKIKEEMQRKMIALGIWESRKGWSRTEWSQWWRKRTIELNQLRAEDLVKLPLMQSELVRVVKTFPLRVTPKPFGKQKIGVLHPFF